MNATAMGPLYLRAALPRFGARPTEAPSLRLRRERVRPVPADVAAYASCVGQPPSDRLPLLYPHLLGFGLQMQLMTAGDFPFPALGLIHVSNVVTATRPLLLGEVLDVEVHADAVRPHARGRVVDLVTSVTADGEPVWHETSTYLRRERTSSDQAPGTGASPAPEAPADAVPLYFSTRWRLPGGLGRSYARVSGDVNPIHLSALTARPLGFRRAIAHGMWTAAAVAAALDGRLPPAVRYEVTFRRPISLPATVRLFTGPAGTGAAGGMAAEVRGRDGDDRPHLTAIAR